MNKLFSKKTVISAMLGLAVAGMSTSAFAATSDVKSNESLNKSGNTNDVQQYDFYNYFNCPQSNSYYAMPQMGNQQPEQQSYQPVYYYYTPDYSNPAANKTATKPVYEKPAADKQQPSKQQDSAKVSDYAKQVVQLVNKERAKAGLSPLRLDAKLSGMAMDKAKDMNNNHYFDHNSPTYGSPFDMMNKYGIQYGYAGENIAMGQQSPDQVMKDWMNSQGHRENIMNPNYDTIGVAFYNGYWVQEFISSK